MKDRKCTAVCGSQGIACPCHLARHSPPPLAAWGHPAASIPAGQEHREWAGGCCQLLEDNPSRNQERNETKSSWQENTIPMVSDRERRLRIPSCRRVDRGQPRPRLADSRYLLRSCGAAWLRGHVTWVPTHSPTVISGGPETIPSPRLSFFTPLAFASQQKPHSTGSLCKQPPQSAPRPAAILEKGRRYF